ncbi:nucleotidyltransferase family protein [Lederbergia ruris]|uniref:nucleotidyltransferase family protein n=1 Tax=Lederbergia ruris TaxID=217495 RepID=UPI00399FC806
MSHLKNIGNCFYNYCKDNEIDLTGIVKEDKRLLNFFNHIAMDEEIRTMSKRYLCKNLYVNTFLLDELRSIQDIFNSAGVRMILLKGFILGDELFQDIYRRHSNDIDLYIHPDDMKLACKLLGDEGYLLELEEVKVTESSVDRDPFLAYGNHHMEPLVKEISNGQRICIEIHRCPYHKVRFDFGENDYSTINPDELFARGEIHNLNGLEIMKLDVNDFLINLLQHFTTHFFNDLREYIWYKKINPAIDIGLLHELTLYMLIKQDVIDYNKVYRRAFEWGILDDINFALHCVRGIFGESVYISKEHSLESVISDNADFARRMMKDFASIDTHKLVCGEIDQEVLDLLRNNSKHILTVNAPQAPQRLSVEYNIINYLRSQDFQPFPCTLELSWDEEYLFIRLLKLDFDRIVHTKKRQGFLEQEGFCILFFFQEPNVHFIESIYVNVENNMERVLDYQQSSYLGKNVFIPEYCVAKAIREKNNDRLDIKLNWKFLNIVPKKGMKIAFRIFEANAFATYEFMTMDRGDIIELS